eukprot:gene14035-16545_t
MSMTNEEKLMLLGEITEEKNLHQQTIQAFEAERAKNGELIGVVKAVTLKSEAQQAHIEELQKSVIGTQKKLVDERKNGAALATQLAKADEERAKAVEAAETLTHQLQEAAISLQEREDIVKLLRNQGGDDASALVEREDAHRQAMETTAEEMRTMRRRTVELEDELIALRGQTGGLEKQVAELTRALEEREAQDAGDRELAEKYSQLLNKMDEEKINLEIANETIEELHAQLRDYEANGAVPAEHEPIEAGDFDDSGLLNENEELQTKVQALEREIETISLQKNSDEERVNARIKEIESLKDQLRIEKESSIEYQTKYDRINRQLTTLRSTMEEEAVKNRANVLELETKLLEHQEQIETYQQEITVHREEVERLATASPSNDNDSQQQDGAFQTKYLESLDLIKDLEMTLESEREFIKDLSNNYEDLKKKKSTLKQNLKRLQEDHDRLVEKREEEAKTHARSMEALNDKLSIFKQSKLVVESLVKIQEKTHTSGFDVDFENTENIMDKYQVLETSYRAAMVDLEKKQKQINEMLVASQAQMRSNDASIKKLEMNEEEIHRLMQTSVEKEAELANLYDHLEKLTNQLRDQPAESDSAAGAEVAEKLQRMLDEVREELRVTREEADVTREGYNMLMEQEAAKDVEIASLEARLKTLEAAPRGGPGSHRTHHRENSVTRSNSEVAVALDPPATPPTVPLEEKLAASEKRAGEWQQRYERVSKEVMEMRKLKVEHDSLRDSHDQLVEAYQAKCIEVDQMAEALTGYEKARKDLRVAMEIVRKLDAQGTVSRQTFAAVRARESRHVNFNSIVEYSDDTHSALTGEQRELVDSFKLPSNASLTGAKARVQEVDEQDDEDVDAELESEIIIHNSDDEEDDDSGEEEEDDEDVDAELESEIIIHSSEDEEEDDEDVDAELESEIIIHSSEDEEEDGGQVNQLLLETIETHKRDLESLESTVEVGLKKIEELENEKERLEAVVKDVAARVWSVLETMVPMLEDEEKKEEMDEMQERLVENIEEIRWRVREMICEREEEGNGEDSARLAIVEQENRALFDEVQESRLKESRAAEVLKEVDTVLEKMAEEKAALAKAAEDREARVQTLEADNKQLGGLFDELKREYQELYTNYTANEQMVVQQKQEVVRVKQEVEKREAAVVAEGAAKVAELEARHVRLLGEASESVRLTKEQSEKDVLTLRGQCGELNVTIERLQQEIKTLKLVIESHNNVMATTTIPTYSSTNSATSTNTTNSTNSGAIDTDNITKLINYTDHIINGNSSTSSSINNHYATHNNSATHNSNSSSNNNNNNSSNNNSSTFGSSFTGFVSANSGSFGGSSGHKMMNGDQYSKTNTSSQGYSQYTNDEFPPIPNVSRTYPGAAKDVNGCRWTLQRTYKSIREYKSTNEYQHVMAEPNMILEQIESLQMQKNDTDNRIRELMGFTYQNQLDSLKRRMQQDSVYHNQHIQDERLNVERMELQMLQAQLTDLKHILYKTIK